MSIRLDISKGVDPVPMSYDIRADIYKCWVDGFSYAFDSREMRFTLRDGCADRALILKYADRGGHSNG